jgi:tRNA dimethylallyltransferase
MTNDVRDIYVLTGPTAVGKTELALRWAERHNAEIISCDSLLFYRGMDIGTAKPSLAERARVPHHLIDLRDITEPMDITEYVAHVRTALEAITGRGRRVLVAGGSGFYLKAFFSPVADDIAVPAALRASVATALEGEGLESLVAQLRSLNPKGVGSLDTANPRRVVRALERCLASGRTLEELSDAFSRAAPPFQGWTPRLVRLDRSAEELAARIDERVAGMLNAGLLQEVEMLLQRGLVENPSASKAIGYRECIAVLAGTLPPADLAAEIVRNTRALVKKQRTWFRTQLPAHTVIPAANAGEELFNLDEA